MFLQQAEEERRKGEATARRKMRDGDKKKLKGQKVKVNAEDSLLT
jgi:hypothetical protein